MTRHYRITAAHEAEVPPRATNGQVRAVMNVAIALLIGSAMFTAVWLGLKLIETIGAQS